MSLNLWSYLEPIGLFLSALAPLTVILYNFIEIRLPHRDHAREDQLKKALREIESGDEVFPDDVAYSVFFELAEKYRDERIRPDKFKIFHGGYGSGALGLHFYSRTDGEFKHEGYIGSKELISRWIRTEIRAIERAEERIILLVAAAILLIGLSLQFVAYFL